MNTTRQLHESGARFLAAVAIATVLATWLRTWGITGQVVLDDEWHAIHKLMHSPYREILRSFGVADHSIPLTLFYKAMAETIGLAEGRLRALQVVSGIALVPLSAWLARRATDDAPAAALLALLVAGAPFLVMWSRFARPYAIMVLLTVACIGALWRWRTHRTWRVGAWAVSTAALSAWFHPLSGLYAALGWLFIFLEDVAVPVDGGRRPSRQSLELGMGIGIASFLLLAAPLIHDGHALAAKAGGDQPDFSTYERMMAIFWGGIPTSATWLACAVAAWGAVALLRRDGRLGAYIVLLTAGPPAVVTLLGAAWVYQGQNLGRYVLPSQVLVLFLGSVGAIDIVRHAARGHAQAAAWIATAILSGAYLAATPAMAQVATLGPWYGHLDYHWDYRSRDNAAKRNDPAFSPPGFYRELGRMAPGSAPIIEAPFSYEAPANELAYYATFHRQPETLGMLHGLCLQGPVVGEPPEHDRRFRFRKFVFLDDVQAVRRTGARYLLLLRGPLHGQPFDADACIAKLAPYYGTPIVNDTRVAVFDLRPASPR